MTEKSPGRQQHVPAALAWTLARSGTEARNQQMLPAGAGAATTVSRTPSLESQWQAYLSSLWGRASVRRGPAAGAQKFWTLLRQAAGVPIRPPKATPSGEGGLFLSWDLYEHHLGIEIVSENRYEWFYIDGTTDDADSGEQWIGETPSRFLDHIRSIAAAH